MPPTDQPGQVRAATPPPEPAHSAPAPAAADQDIVLPTPQPADPATPRNIIDEPWFQQYMPWATSILIHLAILAVGLATYEAVASYREVVEQQTIIPEAAFAVDGEGGGIPNG